MPIAFGFSAGDFISALNLVSTVTNALREAGGTSAEFRGVVHELLTLETALIRVKWVDLDDSQIDVRIALQQAASRCQHTIDEFWTTAQKYQPHLESGGTGARLRDGWMRIKWTLCKKEDLERFKADIRGHAVSIELLLTTIQLDQASVYRQRQEGDQRTMLSRLQYMSNRYMSSIAVVTGALASSASQGKELLKKLAEIVGMNVRIFQLVYDTYNIVKRIPPQVERQQPVYMTDAMGRTSPFHLEFIQSSEALISVLMANFKPIPSGRKKIEMGEFILQDAGSKREIALAGDWNACFAPGQRVEMSMVFRLCSRLIESSCPGCKVKPIVPKDASGTIECLTCGMTFCRIRSEWPERISELNFRLLTYKGSRGSLDLSTLKYGEKFVQEFEYELKRTSKAKLTGSYKDELKRRQEVELGEDPTLFRRVRMIDPAEGEIIVDYMNKIMTHCRGVGKALRTMRLEYIKETLFM